MKGWYKIRVRGQLDPDWAEWFEGMEIKSAENDETILCGRIQDQAALFGILNKLRNLGLELIAVNCLGRRQKRTRR